MKKDVATINRINRFVHVVCQDLSQKWERRKSTEDGFYWMSMVDMVGHMTVIDLFDLFNNVPVEMNPRGTEGLLSDAINILTYENRAVEAVLCHNSVILPRTASSYGARSMIAFNYHGQLGQKINHRSICVIDEGLSTVYNPPVLGDYERRVYDVRSWRDAEIGAFRDLIPHQRIVSNVIHHGGKWWVVVCDLVPAVLPDKTRNGFETKFDALEYVRVMEAEIYAQRVEQRILPKINEELYNMRKERCPLKIGIRQYGRQGQGSDQPR